MISLRFNLLIFVSKNHVDFVFYYLGSITKSMGTHYAASPCRANGSQPFLAHLVI